MSFEIFPARQRRTQVLIGASTAAISLALLMPAAAFARPLDLPAAVTAVDAVAAPQTAPTPAPLPSTEAPAPTDQPANPQSDDPSTPSEASDIVVTGFRRSLQAALDLKRNATGSVDAIVAEDIAKMPDQNLAESLQRIPGIAIQRDAGEGRAITVRGLGSQFTRVRLNGMETITTASDGAGADRDRAFDFNVFASELFNSVVVHKTAEPSLDEGSLGAVVDLNTGNPLAGKEGLTVVGSASLSYNDLAEKAGPRVAGLIGWKSPSGKFGVSFSAAYSKLKTLELSNNTVRWGQAEFDSVDGVPCFYNGTAATGLTGAPNSGGTYRPGMNAGCDAVSFAFHPRIPRYGEVAHDRERLGLTGSIQWAPSDRTKLSIDGLYSRFVDLRQERWGEVLLRSNERSVDVSDYTIDGNNNLIKATFNDAYVRTEHFNRRQVVDFLQLGATLDQDLSDKFRFTILGGFSRSNADVPQESTLMLDDKDAQGYSYDYTDSRNPKLTFGTSVTDPANFQLAEIRDRPSYVHNKFRTAQLRTEWDVADGFQLKTGAVYRRYDFSTWGAERGTVVCPAKATSAPDVVLGTVTCSPSTVFGPNAVYGLPVDGSNTELFNLGPTGQPGGNTNQWLVASYPGGSDYVNLYQRTPIVDLTAVRSVSETTYGGYLQFDAKGDFLGLDYSFNGGIRYVRTDQGSDGYNNNALVHIDRSYDDWLPSFNLALYPTKNIILRGSIGKVITRPTLGSLTPGGSVDGNNFRVNFGNPQLDPYRATAFDAAFEWYFRPGSIFSVALFAKNVQSFPVGQAIIGTYASTGLPTSLILSNTTAYANPEAQLWTINTTVNGTGAKLRGIEVSLQTPFSFLPGLLRNFGVLLNATLVDSNAKYTIQPPSTAFQAGGGLLIPPAQVYESTLYGLSKRSFNGTLYYEGSKFSARASISYRSPFVDQGSSSGNIFEGYNSTINVDASIRYKLTKQLEISLEGVNLTDEYRDRYVDEADDRAYENNHFGRTILIGARFKM